jgi:hypothetical protein
MVDKALVLENRRGIMERKRKMQHTGAQETTRSSVMVFLLKDLFSVLVSSKGCKL